MRRFIQTLQTRDPDMALRLRSSQFDLTLRKLVSKHKFDIVQVEGIELAWTISILREIRLNQRILFDAHNAEAILQQRAYEADLKNWPSLAGSGFFQITK